MNRSHLRAPIGVIVASLGLGLGVSSAAWAESLFFPLGDLPNGAFSSTAWAISEGGYFAAGSSDIGGSLFSRVNAAFRWSPAVGMIPVLDDSANGGSCTAYAISADGQTFAGTADYGFFSDLGTQAWITTASGPVLIGDLPGGISGVPRSNGRALSAYGRVLAGTGESDNGSEAFRWTEEEGFTPLGDLPGGAFGSYANAISADGVTIVGVSYSGSPDAQQAFRWTPGTGMVGLGLRTLPPGFFPASSANAVSADGSVIVGDVRTEASPNGGEAYRWTAADGMVTLGDLPGGNLQSTALAVSADGLVIVGRGTIEGPGGPFGGGSQSRAFLWTQSEGMRDLQGVLSSRYGIDLTGWSLQEARAISPDGRAIAGNGRDPQGNSQAWLVWLDAECAGDVNNDDRVDLLDLATLLVHFGTPGGATLDEGDVDGDGDVDLNDLATVLVAFGTNCL